MKKIFLTMLFIASIAFTMYADYPGGAKFWVNDLRYQVAMENEEHVFVITGIDIPPYDFGTTMEQSYINLADDVVIPSEVTYQGKTFLVVGIWYRAFCLCPDITSIRIPSSIKTIGTESFYGCEGLSEIQLPDSLLSIDPKAFWGCTGLNSVTVPVNIEYIGSGAFYKCDGLKTVHFNARECGDFSARSGISESPEFPYTLQQIVFGNEVKRIPAYFAKKCSSLKTLNFSASIQEIGDEAFTDCVQLTSIDIPESVSSIGNKAFYGCSGLTSLSISKSVEVIGTAAFSGCTALSSLTWNAVSVNSTGQMPTENITQLTIGENVELIPSELVQNSKITSVIIPNSVIEIGSDAFYGCTQLTSVDIPESVTVIGSWAFADCASMKNLTLGQSVTTIGEYAFRNCSQLTSVEIPASVTGIGSSAFEGCTSMKSLTLGQSLVTIGNSVFKDCSQLESLTIPASVTDIQYQAFNRCSGLTSIKVHPSNPMYDSRDDCNAIINKENNELILGCKETLIPESVKIIGTQAFEACSGLNKILFPEGLSSIESMAFNGCTGLKELTLPVSITSIKNRAFGGCTGIKKITSLSQTPPTIVKMASNSGTFLGISLGTPVYVPAGTMETYWTTEGWDQFLHYFELENEGPEPNKCDVNGDGKVDIADVNAVIGAMLGK